MKQFVEEVAKMIEGRLAQGEGSGQ